MNCNHLHIFQKTLASTGINAILLKKDLSNLSALDTALRMELYNGEILEQSIAFLKHWLIPERIIRYVDKFRLNYFLIYVPEKYCKEDEFPYFVAGPFFYERIATDNIHQLMREYDIPNTLFPDILTFFNTIPEIGNINSLESMVLTLSTELFEQNYHISYLPKNELRLVKSQEELKKVQEQTSITSTSIEERYNVENQMLDAITVGDFQEAYAAHQKFTSFYIHPRTEDLLRNKQNFQVILNTIARKAAERAGVHPLYLDDVSTKFAIKINHAKTTDELDKIARDLVYQYCLLTKKHSLQRYSPVVKNIISYIDFHFMEDLSLSYFADMFNITKTYLSSLFKKETGSTLTDFIHQIRMRRAITLMNSSTLPVTEIAEACGYHDISYFIRIFKKNYKISPKQYQKNIQKTLA